MERKIKLESDEETGAMAQLLRAPVVLIENPSSVPSSHAGWFTTICDQSPRNPMPLISLGSTLMWHVPTHSEKRSWKSNGLYMKQKSGNRRSDSMEVIRPLGDMAPHIHLDNGVSMCAGVKVNSTRLVGQWSVIFQCLNKHTWILSQCWSLS